MMRRLVPLVAAVTAAGLLIAGCAQSAPAPAPTQAPNPPAKAAEPTKAAAPAQPTAAPDKKVDFPTKGKAINLIVPYPAGGDVDIGARILAPLMEKGLGTPVQVVNKGGAGGQVGITELAKSKPDGYTFGYTPIPSGITMYLDPERKSAFTRTDLQPIGNHVVEPDIIGVKADSPYKSLKDLIDAAKANPKTIAVGFTGLLSHQHLAILQMQKLAGAQFNIVSFDGSAPALAALLGGHIQVQVGSAGLFLPQVKNGEVRLLGVLDKEETKFFPDLKTAEAQGYPIVMGTVRILSVPAGTPKEVVDVLSGALKKALDSDEHKKKMDEVGLSARSMTPAEATSTWVDMEGQIQPLMDLAKQQK